jgi:5-methylcytosine-specific restriction enzyme A
MPWDKTAADREHDARTYGTAEYRRNRAIARRRADGRCEQCGHPHTTLQCDHIIPLADGGTHDLGNLRMVCKGPGTCKCHETKTAQEGGGYRKPATDPQPRPGTRW